MPYLNDVLIIRKKGETDKEHLAKIKAVIARLEERGFQANIRMSFFLQKDIEYLGYLLTYEGIKPQPKKNDIMRQDQAPKNHTQLKGFLGMINFYWDMWPRRSHILALLYKLGGGNKKSRPP